MNKVYITPVNRRIKAMKIICSHYPHIICRDVQIYWNGSPPLRGIRDQFQIGYLPTLTYITFHRREVTPLVEWVEGFIEAARARESYYKSYRFYE